MLILIFVNIIIIRVNEFFLSVLQTFIFCVFLEGLSPVGGDEQKSKIFSQDLHGKTRHMPQVSLRFNLKLVPWKQTASSFITFIFLGLELIRFRKKGIRPRYA